MKSSSCSGNVPLMTCQSFNVIVTCNCVHVELSSQIAMCWQCTGCSIMIAPPSRAETSKMLVKLLLYYNSLNKVTLLCKVSDWCVLFSLKNQELQISNPCGCQQQQQQHPKIFSLTVSVLTHNISTFLGENQWPGTTKFCLKIMWTAVPVSLN